MMWVWSAEYIGCFKTRHINMSFEGNREHRWYDPHHQIFLGDDSRYAEGPFYAVHARVIGGILRSGLMPRLGGPEGACPSHCHSRRLDLGASSPSLEAAGCMPPAWFDT
jgi:hypothetical protein